MSAATTAMPVNPNSAATSDMTRKNNAHLNIAHSSSNVLIHAGRGLRRKRGKAAGNCGEIWERS
jgi:hypothetical protein